MNITSGSSAVFFYSDKIIFLSNSIYVFLFTSGMLGFFNQLRDMHGFKSVTKIAPTDPSGEKPYEPPTDADRARALVELLRKGGATDAKTAAPTKT